MSVPDPIRPAARIAALAAALGAVNARLATAARGLAGALLAAMTVLIAAGVVGRYGFGANLGGAEELAKAAMAWIAFLVAPGAWRDGAHARVGLFAEALAPGLARAVSLAVAVAATTALIVLFTESFGFVARGMALPAASLPVPMGVFYAIAPPALAAAILVGVELTLRTLAEALGAPGPSGRTVA